MPIYDYQCQSCGHQAEVLQKMSDEPLTECPKCGASAFKKQVSAPSFKLKGTGWYETDFKTKKKPPSDSGTSNSAASTSGSSASSSE